MDGRDGRGGGLGLRGPVRLCATPINTPKLLRARACQLLLSTAFVKQPSTHPSLEHWPHREFADLHQPLTELRDKARCLYNPSASHMRGMFQLSSVFQSHLGLLAVLVPGRRQVHQPLTELSMGIGLEIAVA